MTRRACDTQPNLPASASHSRPRGGQSPGWAEARAGAPARFLCLERSGSYVLMEHTASPTNLCLALLTHLWVTWSGLEVAAGDRQS